MTGCPLIEFGAQANGLAATNMIYHLGIRSGYKPVYGHEFGNVCWDGDICLKKLMLPILTSSFPSLIPI